MRTTFPFLVAVVIAGALTSGCANVEKKFSRGMNNLFEPVRLGEIRRSVEQSALYGEPGTYYTIGVVQGLNRTLVRTGLGAYEVATAPLPPYDPVLTGYLSPNPVFPANYDPGVLADAMFATDTDLGFSGGDVAPFIPGSRFRVFDIH